MCWLARLTNLAERVRAFLDAGCGKALVDGKRDAGDLSAVHSFTRNRVATFVCDTSEL